MSTEICIPNKNEEKFIEIAEKLDIKELIFLYNNKEADLTKIQEKTKIKILTGKLDKKNPKQTTFCKGTRQNIEDKNCTHIYGLETIEEKEHYHYRKSGMNQVHAKLIKEKNKTLVFDIEKILESKEPEKILGRMKQNLKLAKKYDLKIIICSMATKPENLRTTKHYQALIKTLGYEEQAKKATQK
ncbi:hypothetical protein K9L67_02480 [Candidatus Woesearchaeota archaeon]|nr:hypothetical protein [Candidatus Woesearchaeota archaeon]MCF7901072.1 hypothetical protein [Candidatus Woesearchaeota archaeon]MCF8013623.1 hypothetical protein [Candidatus Woesearchaeota archaeon]